MSRNMNAETVATDKQNVFAAKLYHEAANTQNLTVDQRDILDRLKGHEPVTKKEASYLIDGLIQSPKKERPAAQPGYYLADNGDYVVVVENRAKTRTYAKRLQVTEGFDGKKHAKWVYAPGVGADLAKKNPMTLTEAAAFGHLHGFCLVCAKALTDPVSVKRGIGPVCAKNFRR